MEIKTNPESFFVFDLDDTLFPEIRFLQSAYRHIANRLKTAVQKDLYEEMYSRYRARENVFQWLAGQYESTVPYLTTDWLLAEYRSHVPDIELAADTRAFIDQVKKIHVPAGLITDGRSITQRNKLKALGIENFFTDIIISEEFGSEKPAERNYLFFEEKYPAREFYFFGDNTSKDFIVPAKLGWKTICMLDTGSHIHKQAFDKPPVPDYTVSSFNEIKLS